MRIFGDNLHKAAQMGKADALRRLLEKGHDANELSKEGVTPLFYTANTGSVECARLLLDYGADVNAAVPGGGTPLHSALLKKHEDLARWLLLKGANPNAATAVGVTPLHLAAQMGMASSVAGLLREGAKLDTLTQKGQSALFMALYGMYEYDNDDSAALALFEAGADPRLNEEFERRLATVANLRENIAATWEYGLSLLAEKSGDPEIRDFAKKTLIRIRGLEQKDAESGKLFIESLLLGRMEQGEFRGWWTVPAVQIPFWDNKSVQLTYTFDPDEDPDFLAEADAAVRNFLQKGPEARTEVTPHLDLNFQVCSEIVYDGVTRDMLTDWQREVLDYEDRERLWELVTPHDYMHVERRHRRDRDIYVILPCACEWEEEHGLQLVYRRGLELTRVSQEDGWAVEADAFDIPDEEDELLSAFNRKYGADEA